MTFTDYKLVGATLADQQEMARDFATMKGVPVGLTFKFDGRARDSGTVGIENDQGGSEQRLSYRVSGNWVTLDGTIADVKFHFEGEAARKDNAWEIAGDFNAEGTGPGDRGQLVLLGTWKARSPSTNVTSPTPQVPVPATGGTPLIDVKGVWSGSMTLSSYRLEGATADELRDLDADFADAKDEPVDLTLLFDGKTQDSGSVALDSDVMDSGEKFAYRVSGDRVTITGASSDATFQFDGRIGRKGSGYEIAGEFTAQGPGPDGKKKLTVLGSWKVSK